MSTMNRLFNVSNPNQGNALKVLCVCSAGLLRSPTAAFVLQQELGYNTRSAGAVSEYALIPVDEVLLQWAELVVFMEQAHEQIVFRDFPEIMKSKKFRTLNIPDVYQRMDMKLQNIIMNQFSRPNDN